jgi:hypothetical protein
MTSTTFSVKCSIYASAAYHGDRISWEASSWDARPNMRTIVVNGKNLQTLLDQGAYRVEAIIAHWDHRIVFRGIFEHESFCCEHCFEALTCYYSKKFYCLEKYFFPPLQAKYW